MEDTERLLRALHNLIESEDRRIAQREEEWKKEKERTERRKELYRRYYGSSSSMTFYVPKDSALLDTNINKGAK